jgi:serine/threonine-protein kinase HipA
MALMLGGTKRWPDRRKLEGFGKRNCNLPAADVVEVMDAVAEGVSATLSEIKRWMSDAPAFREVGERMLTAWREGLASLG